MARSRLGCEIFTEQSKHLKGQNKRRGKVINRHAALFKCQFHIPGLLSRYFLPPDGQVRLDDLIHLVLNLLKI